MSGSWVLPCWRCTFWRPSAIPVFSQALIHRQGDIRGYLNAAWTIQVLRGAILAIALLVGAPLVAAFFETPEATAIVRWLALVMVLSGLNNIGVVYFDKELQFRERFVFRSVPQVADLLVSAVAAVILRNVWALVIGLVAAAVVRLVASYRGPSVPPQAHRRLGEGLGVVQVRCLGPWIKHAGLRHAQSGRHHCWQGAKSCRPWFLPIRLHAFRPGCHSKSPRLSARWPSRHCPKSRVIFPACAGPIYARFLLVAVVVFPFAAGLWFVGPQAVEVFLGSRWMPLIAAYEVLVLWGLIRSLGSTTHSLFKAVGKPYIVTGIQLSTVVILAVAIYPLTINGGIAGAAWATVIAAVPFVASLFIASRLLELNGLEIPSTAGGPGAGDRAHDRGPDAHQRHRALIRRTVATDLGTPGRNRYIRRSHSGCPTLFGFCQRRLSSQTRGAAGRNRRGLTRMMNQ